MITIICDDCEMVYEIEAAEMEECHGCASPDDFRVASDRDLEDMEPFWKRSAACEADESVRAPSVPEGGSMGQVNPQWFEDDVREKMARKLTKAEAFLLLTSRWWAVGEFTHEEVAEMQLRQERLCMPFATLQNLVNRLLGRLVWTHEFSDRPKLLAELRGEIGPPETDWPEGGPK